MIARNINRLILGERQAVLQEARQHGGAFIDPHPEALKMLQENDIDPYMIYERALIQKIEEKTPRIEFVQADVDQLFEAWKSKPEARAPIHVRLIVWLKNNAATYGYEQSENSWVLKH